MKSNYITRGINVRTNDYILPIEYVQGTNMIDLQFEIYDFVIPTGSTATVHVTRPDRTVEYDAATVDTATNTVTVDVKNTMFSVAGTSKLQVAVLNGDDKLVTFEVQVNVRLNNTADGTQSKDVISAIDSGVEKAAASATAAANSATAAEESAASAASAETNVTNLAATASQKAQDATTSASNAKTSETNAATSADKAAASANGVNLATIESSTTASKAYAVGDYLVLSGSLYKVTAAIASGGTIAAGTNVTASKLADDVASDVSQLNETITDIERTVGILSRDIPDWIAVQKIVRDGLASKYFAVGDKLQCKRGNTVLTWDVLGFDHDVPVDTTYTHSMTLGLHDCIQTFQYDAPEALYYAATELAAGTYNYTLGTVSGWAIGDGATRQFTLTSAVPAGGQIRVNGDATTATSTATSYSSRTSTTAIETATVTAGNGGTALTTLNHVQRIPYGSNNWQASAARLWLNSDAAANAWWSPQSIYDRQSANAGIAGFLNGMDADFLAVIGKVNKTTALNTINEGGGSVTLQEKFFLLSRPETYFSKVNGINEGLVYDYYKIFSSLSSLGDSADTNRIKKIIGGTSSVYWWLRSPSAGNTCVVCGVSSAGATYGSYAGSSLGLSPVCNII